MKIRNTIILLIALLSFGKGYAQTIPMQDMDKFHIMEDSLIVTADSMYNALIPDTRIAYSERFAKQLVRTLKIPNSYYYTFDKLKDIINILYSEDKVFRMFNWEIVPSQVMKVYFGAIQLPQEKLKLYGLRDYSEQLGRGAEDSILTGGKWFGALYYRIMPVTVGGKKVYNMFGLNSSDPRSNKKIIDPMIIDEKGITFGAPIFGVASNNFRGQRINRFVLEYKKEVRVSLNWDNERQLVVFDRLISQVNDPNRKYTYVPSGEYDGLKWGNDMWNYVRDLIPVQLLKDGQRPDMDPEQPSKVQYEAPPQVDPTNK